jgi:hypothetical protein
MIGRVLLGLLSAAIWANGAQAQGAAPVFQTGQYNSTLPTFASGATSYLATDSNGRLIQSPGASVIVTTLPSLAAGSAIVGKVGIDQTTNGTTNGVYVTNTGLPVAQGNGTSTAVPWVVANNVGSASGGISSFYELASSSAGSPNLTQVKSGAGRIYKITGYNNSTGPRRLRFYDALSANVTVGTTTAKFTRILPAGAAFSFDFSDIGASFTTGISFAIVQSATLTDTTGPAAGDITDLSIGYQ